MERNSLNLATPLHSCPTCSPIPCLSLIYFLSRHLTPSQAKFPRTDAGFAMLASTRVTSLKNTKRKPQNNTRKMLLELSYPERHWLDLTDQFWCQKS